MKIAREKSTIRSPPTMMIGVKAPNPMSARHESLARPHADIFTADQDSHHVSLLFL